MATYVSEKYKIIALAKLGLRKDTALLRPKESFAPKFYAFAEYFLCQIGFCGIRRLIRKEEKYFCQSSIYSSFRRINRIYCTYNPKVYKSLRNRLIRYQRNLDILALDAQYNALKKCVDIETEINEKLCYDKTFGMTADKQAIQEIFSYVEAKF